MSTKKLALYVEGQTEQILLNQLTSSNKSNPDLIILNRLKTGLRILKCSDLEKIEIFFAVMEIEAWLLAFSKSVSKWGENSKVSIPSELEKVKRPSSLMGKIGESANRGHHKSYDEMISFVSSITREDIVDVYNSNKVPSFNRFWSRLLSLTE
jgi:hypothetical protein